MSKMTRKQYDIRATILAKSIAETSDYLQQLSTVVLALDDAGFDMSEINGIDVINGISDMLDALKAARVDLDHEWERRNWTGAEHASHRLVCENVD